jgi:hypothetical protein
MAKNKLPVIDFGLGDDFESYGCDASLMAKWVESGAGAALATPALGTDQFVEGKKSLKLAINNTTGSTQTYTVIRSYTGLPASTQHHLQVQLRRSAAIGTPWLKSGASEVAMTIPSLNTWGLSGILAVNSSSTGTLDLQIDIRGVTNGQVGDYWFDDAFVGARLMVGFPFDPALAYSVPMDGSEWDQAPSGVEDAWIIGYDQFLDVGIRYIPTTTETVHGVTYTGWDGVAGWRAFLENARNKNYVRVYPDKDALTTYYNMYLVSPIQEAPELEMGGFRRMGMRMRTKDRKPVTGY